MESTPAETLSWLSKQDDAAVKASKLKDCLPGTARWILEVPKLKAWISGLSAGPILWCYSLPGIGHSMLSTVIIEHLEEHTSRPTEAFAYVYAVHDDKPTALSLLSSICRQLASQCLELPWQLVKLHSQMRQEDRRPDVDEIMLLIVAMCDSFSRVFIVVDGVDVIFRENGRAVMLEKLQWMRNHGASILVSSETHGERPEPCGCNADIENALQREDQLHIQYSKSDLSILVETKLKEQDKGLSLLSDRRVCVDDFVRQIVADSGGVYRVAELEVKRALRTLEASDHGAHLDPGLPPEEWKHFLERTAVIRKHPFHLRILANRILNWVVHAVVPLTLVELVHAVTSVLHPDTQFYRIVVSDDDAVVVDELSGASSKATASSIFRLCQDLIRLTDDHHVVLWVDKRLNKTQRSEAFPSGHFQIAHNCLLLMRDSNLIEFDHNPENPPTVEVAPIWDYCQKYWASHYLACDREDDLEDLDRLALLYLNLIAEKPARWIEIRKPMFDNEYEALVTDDESPVLKIARLGLDRLLKQLLATREYDINARSWKDETAISVATTAQHHSSVHLLYRKGASIHYRDRAGLSLLHLAVQKDDEVMVMRLMYCGLRPDTAGGRDFETPFHLAAQKNSVRSGQILLEEKAEIGAAVEEAARAGALEFMKLLVEHGCKLSKPGSRHIRSNALSAAISSGSVPLVEYMIANGADALEQDARRETPIHVAASEGKLEVTQILLDQGADPFAVDNGANEVCEGTSAMSRAIRNGHNGIVEILLPRLSTDVSKESVLVMAIAAVGVDKPDLPLLRKLLSMIPKDIDHAKRYNHDTLLGSALHHADTAVLAMLLKHGVPVETRDAQGMTALHMAAQGGKQNALSMFLNHGADPDLKSRHGMTALHLAAHEGHLDEIRSLLEYGADINAKANDGSTPLLAAAFHSRGDAIRLLLKHGCAVNEPNIDGEIVVHHIIMDNDVDLLKDVLKYGPDLSIQARKASSPLHLAAFKGSGDIVEALIEHGAEVEQVAEYHGGHFRPPDEVGYEAGVLWNQRGIESHNRPHGPWSTTEPGWRPLHSAVCGSHIEVVQILLQHRATLSSKSGKGETPLHVAASACLPNILEELLRRGGNVREVTEDGNTPLHAAAAASIASKNLEMTNRFKCACKMRHEQDEQHEHEQQNRSNCIKMLLAHGADIETENNSGFRPLALAVQAGHKDVVEALINHVSASLVTLTETEYLKLLRNCGSSTDADVLEIVCTVATETKDTVSAWEQLLNDSCPAGNHKLVALAIQRGATLSAKGCNADNPFLMAVVKGHVEVVNLLLEAGASFDEVDELGRNALHLACQGDVDDEYKTKTISHGDNSQIFICRALFEHGAVADVRSLAGDTALHFAVVAGKLSLVDGLIRVGASVDIRNRRGETPLHTAVSTWIFPDIVEHLLSQQACASAQDLAGYTPLHKIRERRAEGLRAVELLLDKGGDASIRARNGDMAHHRAAKRNNWEISRRLMDKTDLINAKGAKGRTVLHIAAKKGQQDVIASLVKLGARWDILDDSGQSPADCLEKSDSTIEGRHRSQVDSAHRS